MTVTEHWRVGGRGFATLVIELPSRELLAIRIRLLPIRRSRSTDTPEQARSDAYQPKKRTIRTCCFLLSIPADAGDSFTKPMS